MEKTASRARNCKDTLLPIKFPRKCSTFTYKKQQQQHWTQGASTKLLSQLETDTVCMISPYSITVLSMFQRVFHLVLSQIWPDTTYVSDSADMKRSSQTEMLTIPVSPAFRHCLSVRRRPQSLGIAIFQIAAVSRRGRHSGGLFCRSGPGARTELRTDEGLSLVMPPSLSMRSLNGRQ